MVNIRTNTLQEEIKIIGVKEEKFLSDFLITF